MNKNCFLLLVIITLFFLIQPVSFAGKIQNLNIKSTNGSTVKVKTGNNSQIDKINVKKDPNSKVIIDNKEVDCNDKATNSDICKP